MLRTIPTLFRQAVDDVPDRPWLAADAGTLTFAEAQDRIERGAAGLRAHGVGPGAIVMVTARNLPAYLLAWLSIMEAGATQLPVNPRSTAAELAGFVHQARPSVLLTDPELRGLVDEALASVDAASRPLVVDVAELAASESDGRGPAAVDPTDVAVLIPTSGTTGRPKATMHFHRDVLANADTFSKHVLRPTPDDLFTGTPPLAFTFGLGGLVVFPLRAGARSLLVERAAPDELADLIANHGVTVVFTAPTAYRSLLAAGRPERLERRFPGCGLVVFGHSHVPEHHVTEGGTHVLNPGSPTVAIH